MKQAIVSVINQKGGVGKTTTAICMASGIAMHNMKVLLVDLDPQAHSTIVLGSDPLQYSLTMQDVLAHRKEISNIIVETKIPNLFLAPSNFLLDKAEQLLIPEMFRETKLSRALLGSDFGYIIIDCRPTLGILSINALYASSIIIVPCEVSRFSLEGFSDLLDMVKTLKKGNNDSIGCILRILLCKYDSRKAISNDWTLKQLDPYKSLLFETRIRQCEALNQAHIAKEPIFTFKPNSHGADDYMSLAKEFIDLCSHLETD